FYLSPCSTQKSSLHTSAPGSGDAVRDANRAPSPLKKWSTVVRPGSVPAGGETTIVEDRPPFHGDDVCPCAGVCPPGGAGARPAGRAMLGLTGTPKLLTPCVTVTVSQSLSLPVARKPIPPAVMTVVEVATCPSSVVPLLSNSLPMILPLVPQSTSRRY